MPPKRNAAKSRRQRTAARSARNPATSTTDTVTITQNGNIANAATETVVVVANGNAGAAAKTQYKSLLLSATQQELADLYKIRTSVIEMLYDGGYDIESHLSTHPSIPATVNLDDFQQFIQAKVAQKPSDHQAIAKELQGIQSKIRAERKPIKEKIKTLSERLNNKATTSDQRDKIRQEQKRLYTQMQNMHKDQLDDVTYNLLTERDLTLSTQRRPVSFVDQQAFKLWMNAAPAGPTTSSVANATELYDPFAAAPAGLTPVANATELYDPFAVEAAPPTPVASAVYDPFVVEPAQPASAADKMVVFFCNEPRIGKETFQFFIKKLRSLGTRNCILVSRDGCTSTIAKSLITKNTDYHIRVFAYKELVVNLIRYHYLVPKYYLLSGDQVKIVEERYGEVKCFPKLKKSRPVVRYYGFSTGDVIAVVYSGKLYGHSNNNNNPDENFIFPVSFKIVIEE